MICTSPVVNYRINSELKELFYTTLNSARSINLSFKFHRMLKCFKASGDTEFSISDYHLLYCYGSDTNNGNKDINTYDICVPTICVTDHLKVNVSCVSIIYFFKIFFENM